MARGGQGMGNAAANAQRRGVSNNARGGRVFAGGGRVPGVGTHDSVNVNNIAAPGELIVNRHTERDVNRMLPGNLTLGRAVAGERRAHSDPVPPWKRGLSERNAARGGRIAEFFKRGGRRRGGGGGGGQVSGIEAAGQLAANMGLHVGEGPGIGGGVPSSGHATNSLHYSGLAYDISGSAEAMRAYFFAALQRFRGAINELFYDPIGYYIDEGNRVPGAIGGHSDHVHIGFFGGANPSMAAGAGGGLGMGAMAAPELLKGKDVKWPGSRVGGAPGGAANKLGEHMKRGLLKKVNKRIMQQAGAGGLGPVGASLRAFQSINHVFGSNNESAGDFSGATLPMKTIASLAEAAGRAVGIDVPGWTMAQVTIGESGRRPGAMGTDPGGTRGLGLWQITTGYNDDLIARFGGEQQMFNPVKNALAMAEIYKRQGYGAWYGTSAVTDTNAHFHGGSRNARGGRVPGFGGWFGNGGTFTTNEPTLIGVGERGKERVTVQPAGKKAAAGARAGRGIQIGAIHIQNHRDGDIEKQVRREIERALNAVADELDSDADGMVT